MIDADVLLEQWNNLSERGRTEFDQVIMNQPTAYDVEKVVEQIHEELFCCNIPSEPVEEIVRSGGVE